MFIFYILNFFLLSHSLPGSPNFPDSNSKSKPSLPNGPGGPGGIIGGNKGGKEGGGSDDSQSTPTLSPTIGRENTPSPTAFPETPSPTISPTISPTPPKKPFNYCADQSYVSGEKCGTFGYTGSFCHEDGDGVPQCFLDTDCQKVGSVCDSSYTCGVGEACGEVCNNAFYCVPLCSYPSAGDYGGADGRCYDETDVSPTNNNFFDTSNGVMSGVSSHLNIFVFATLVVVVVFGTYSIVNSSRLSSQSQSNSQNQNQNKFEELSTMDSVDRAFISKNVIELEPLSDSSSSSRKFNTQINL